MWWNNNNVKLDGAYSTTIERLALNFEFTRSGRYTYSLQSGVWRLDQDGRFELSVPRVADVGWGDASILTLDPITVKKSPGNRLAQAKIEDFGLPADSKATFRIRRVRNEATAFDGLQLMNKLFPPSAERTWWLSKA